MSTTNKGKVGLPMTPQKRHKLFNFKNTRIGGLIGVFLVFAIFVTVSIIGCKKDDITTQTNANKTKSVSSLSMPTISNGRLNFQTEDAFKNFVANYSETDITELNSALLNMGFKSVYYYSQDENNEEELTQKEYPDIHDPYLTSILNSDVEIQIENFVFQITDKYVFKADVNKAHMLNNIDMSQYANANVEEIINVTDGIQAYVAQGLQLKALNYPVIGRNSQSITFPVPYNTTEEFYYSNWAEYYWFYQSIGCKSEFNRKRMWIWPIKRWLSTWTDNLYCQGEVSYKEFKGNVSGTPNSTPIYFQKFEGFTRNGSGNIQTWNKAAGGFNMPKWYKDYTGTTIHRGKVGSYQAPNRTITF